jgi:hypothetical protein
MLNERGKFVVLQTHRGFPPRFSSVVVYLSCFNRDHSPAGGLVQTRARVKYPLPSSVLRNRARWIDVTAFSCNMFFFSSYRLALRRRVVCDCGVMLVHV